MLFDKFGFPKEGRGCGVELACWVFLNGDSGRGRDGLLALSVGLGTRPGPIDWLNLGVIEGVGGVYAVFPPLLREFCVPVEVVGVRGSESPEDRAGDKRLYALVDGRKMPAPLIEVVK